MKTYYLSGRRISIYSLFGFLALAITSCGSYQNSSYNNEDGVYGNSESNSKRAANDSEQNNKYKEYFSDLNKDSESFTNVDNYSSVQNDTVNKTQSYNDSNTGWGNNPQSVTINVYDNNWGWSYWNNYWYSGYWGYNSWYGPSWGWGWNSWYGPSWSVGFGWNNWHGYGGYGGYYGYNNWCNNYYNNYYYSHAGGRRGTAYTGARSNYGGRPYANHSSAGRRGNSFVSNGTRNQSFSGTRSNSNGSGRTNTYSSPRPNTNQSSPTRNNVRTESAPTRSYTPSSSSYGGGRSTYSSGSSSGGGGRSSGGGRR
jgi:hypothetical protein